MKIFGYYLFEDSPEQKEYNLRKENEERQESWDACKNEGSPNHVAMTDLPDADIIRKSPLWGNRYVTGLEEEKFWKKEHLKLVKKRFCHYIYNKKYCYHTGKEIVKE